MVLGRLFALTCAALLFVSSTTAAELKLDPEGSKITFVGTKTDGKHEGGFKKFTSTAIADFENPDNGSLTIEIDATSLWSDDEKLTNHLKNPDFFDVRKFKTITLKSTKIVHSESEEKLTIVGKMTMLGKEVEVKIPVTTAVEGSKLTLKTEFKIDRTKWGMTYGSGKIDNDVQIAAVLVFNM
jgi:polyisoprenoid-binding protein YceI